MKIWIMKLMVTSFETTKKKKKQGNRANAQEITAF